MYILIPKDFLNDIETKTFFNLTKRQLICFSLGAITRTKYITFGIKAKNHEAERHTLERIELSIISNFRKLGVKSDVLIGIDKIDFFLRAIHMNEIEHQPKKFDWKHTIKSGQSVKDYLAPSSFDFGETRHFKTGERYSAVSFLQIFTPEMSDRLLADFLDIKCNQNISEHIHSMDHIKAVKMIKMKLVDLQKTKIDEQKKAVRSGFDMDILSSDLNMYIEELKQLPHDLQGRNERDSFKFCVN